MSLPRRSAPRTFVALASLALALLTSAACGHKRPPIPPPSKVPQRVVLQVHQRGQQAILTFPFPTTTISGTPLPGISKVEIWQYSLEVPEFAVELMAEEATQRKEARKLLDDLGLPLYETPVPVAGLPTPGGAGQDGAPLGATGETGETPPAAAPEDAPPTAQMQGEAASDTRSDALPAEPADDEGAAAADAAANTASGQTEDSQTGDGETEDDQAAEGETAATPLTPEEELALKVEAARTLLKSPPTPKSSFITATKKDFTKGATLVFAAEGDDIANLLIGDNVVLRLPLPARPTEGPEIGHLFGAQVYSMNGKPSDLSERVVVLPSATPPAPRDFVVAPEAYGVMLKWAADEDPEAGFRVYRRDAQARLYGEPIVILPTGSERLYIDRQAIFGARYIYGVTAVASTEPLLESELSSEHEIDYQDRFGPATPVGLVAFPEVGRVRLLWTGVSDADLVGYEIFRRDAGAETPTKLTSELVTRSQYLDENLTSGQVLFYSVVAIDGSGNRSQTSAETEVRVP
jgi:hypothetical protein